MRLAAPSSAVGATVSVPAEWQQTLLDVTNALADRITNTDPYARIVKQARRLLKDAAEAAPSAPPEAQGGERPCETCNDDPAECAKVPGLRHCEKANRAADSAIGRTE